MMLRRENLVLTATTRLTLDAAPRQLRIVEGDLDSATERWLLAAQERAFELGLRQGHEQALTQAAGALEKAAMELDNARELAIASVAKSTIELAIGVARILLRREIASGAYELERIVRESLSLSGVGRGACVVHVHPDDARTLSNVSFRSGTAIEADPNVSRGCVQVSSPHGLLVRDHEEALRLISRAWQEVVT